MQDTFHCKKHNFKPLKNSCVKAKFSSVKIYFNSGWQPAVETE